MAEEGAMNLLALTIASASLLTLTTAQPSTAQASPVSLPTLAIVDFETTPAGSIIPPPHLGGAIADLMLDRLVASGSYRVLDARWLPGSTAGATSRAGIEALRLKLQDAGVDYVILGSMTRFTMEEQHRTLGAGAFIPVLGGLKRRKSDLAVAITVRVVDVRTGEVATTATSQGVAGRKHLALGLAALVTRGGAGGYSRSSSGSRDAMLDEAVRRAVATAAQGIVNAATRLARYSQP
jgi:curli biogenesis system outer membrane secretion channel CsgG